MAVTANTPIENLTFVSAASGKELKNFISTELFHNPNIQNEENVVLLGDVLAPDANTSVSSKTGPGSAAELVYNKKMHFTWTWSPPPGSSSGGGMGYKTSVCFAEYVKRDHSLQQLAKFSMWVESAQAVRGLGRPFSPSPVGIGITGVGVGVGAGGGGGGGIGVDTPLSPAENTTHSSFLASNSPVQTKGIPIPERTTSIIKGVASPAAIPSIIGINSPNQSSTLSTAQAASLSSSATSLAHSPIQPASSGPQTPLPIQDLNPESIGRVIQKEKNSIAIPRPDDGSVSQPEDGPLFRATISNLERKTANLKTKIKKINKRANFLYEKEVALAESQQLFIQSLADAANTEVPAFQPIVHNYFEKRQKTVNFLRNSAYDLNNYVIEPLKKLYDVEIKSFDSRKREFDDESSQYYSWLSRYLSMKQESKGKKKDESVAKYLEKRKAFELTRFDYYSYMQDLNGGRKQQEVTYQLALFAESEVNRLVALGDKMKNSVKPGVDEIVNEVRNANKDWSRQRSEREDRRRALEMSISGGDSSSTNPSEIPITSANIRSKENTRHPSLRIATASLGANSSLGSPKINSAVEKQAGFYDDIITSNEDDSDFEDYEDINTSVNASGAGPITGGSAGTASGTNANANTNTNINTNTNTNATNTTNTTNTNNNTNDDDDSTSESRKEGLLWAMSRPGGFNDPLPNLNKQGWHKFWVVLAGGKLCEYTNWKQGVVDLHNEPINLKVALVREARNTERRFCFEVVTPNYKRVYQATSDDDMNSWIKTINIGISTSLEGNKNESTVLPKHSTTDTKAFRRVLSSSSTDSEYYERPSHSKPPVALHKEINTDLLEIVRKSNASNYQCADCGGSKTEWISINLLVILCIECSGVHRSLGSHISKIRSLTLDTVSFTPELIDLIQSIHNNEVNSIWEKRLSAKPTITDKNRRSFITEKYVEKKFIELLERPNAELRTAVQKQNVKQVLKAIASRANVNLSIALESGSNNEDRSESLLLYALRCSPNGATRFPIAELLLLNGSVMPSHLVLDEGLSTAAREYIKSKIEKVGRPHGERSRIGARTSSNLSVNGSKPTEPLQESTSASTQTGGSKNIGSKLQKRLSVGFSGNSGTGVAGSGTSVTGSGGTNTGTNSIATPPSAPSAPSAPSTAHI